MENQKLGFVVFSDSTMVNHYKKSPPFGRICLVHFFHPHQGEANPRELEPKHFFHHKLLEAATFLSITTHLRSQELGFCLRKFPLLLLGGSSQ